MLAGCASILPVATHLPLLHPPAKVRQFRHPGFMSVGGQARVAPEGYKVQSEMNLTKSARKRNKRRQSKHNDAVPLVNYKSGTLSNVGVKNLDLLCVETIPLLDTVVEEGRVKDAVDAGTSSPSMTPSLLIKATSSSSYAAVVSGLSNRELVDNISGLEVGQVTLPNGSSELLVVEQRQFSMGPASTTRDIGVQVNIERGPQSTSHRNQSTMTKKGKYKNKFVTVQMCCVGSGSANRSPAVEFLGDHFTFERAISETVANFGITFAEFKDDEVPIFPK